MTRFLTIALLLIFSFPFNASKIKKGFQELLKIYEGTNINDYSFLENNRKGNFIRIYPSRGSEIYDPFF